MNKMRVVKKSEPRQPVVLRIGARVTVITFPKRKDGRIKGEVKYHTDYAYRPKVTWCAENNAKTEV